MLILGSRGCFQGGGPGGADFQVGDVGAEPPHGTGPGKLSAWVREADNRDTAKDTGGEGIGITTSGVSDR